jgi:hypothetical protein
MAIGKIKLAAVAVAAAVAAAHATSDHAPGAPADPYGPCPAGSYYKAVSEPDSYWPTMTGVPGSKPPEAAGVVQYGGDRTELASCVASLQAGIGGQP